MRRALAALAIVAIGGPALAAGKPVADPVRCHEGYVWRLAAADDHVCVPVETHRRTISDNALAATRIRQRSTELCRNGFVWRQAFPGDHVCVSPQTRDEAEADNGREREPAPRITAPPSPTCRLVDVDGLARRLGFGPGAKLQTLGEHGCSIRFSGEANGEITFGFEKNADALVAARDFHRLHNRTKETIAGLGDAAAYEARNGVDAWTHHLAALHENVSIEIVYEGDPVPSGADELAKALIDLARQLLTAIPVTPKCAPSGESEDCPIILDLPDRRDSQATLTGEIGRVQTWTYAVSGETGQTISIDFSGDGPIAGGMRCPGVSPRVWDRHGELRLPTSGRCLVRVGAKPGGATGKGAFVLTLHRS